MRFILDVYKANKMKPGKVAAFHADIDVLRLAHSELYRRVRNVWTRATTTLWTDHNIYHEKVLPTPDSYKMTASSYNDRLQWVKRSED